jgi:hypothetical protein
MSGQQQSRQASKRKRPEQHHTPLKRQKVSQHASRTQPPLDFWGDLSKIWLTKYALREFNRRNARHLSHSSARRAPRPVTRAFLKKKRLNTIQSVGDFLQNCASKTVKDIKLFAKHGGPDLSDIRGVCNMAYLLCGAIANNTLSTQNLPVHLNTQ